jgi:hypothetical protein
MKWLPYESQHIGNFEGIIHTILETYVGFSRFINIWMLAHVLGLGKY